MRLRARKAVSAGRFLRANFTLRSVLTFLRDVATDGHVDGTRPWSSLSVGPRGFSWNSRSRRVRADLPGPFYAESDPIRWTDDDGRRWERTDRPDGGSTTRYLPDPVTDEEALTQGCPRCGAEPDHGCRAYPSGRPADPHMPRVELARLARAYPDPPADGGLPPPWGTPPPEEPRDA